MKRNSVITLTSTLLFAGAALFTSCRQDILTPVCDGSKPTYDGEVRIIITNNCNGSSCHGTGSGKHEYTTYALLHKVCTNGKFDARVLNNQSMPKGGTLTQAEINTLQCWSDNNFPEK